MQLGINRHLSFEQNSAQAFQDKTTLQKKAPDGLLYVRRFTHNLSKLWVIFAEHCLHARGMHRKVC